MTDKKLSLFSLSKLTTYEILIEEQIEQLGTVRFQYFKRYLSSQNSLKRRFMISKISGAVIFGILPLIPLLTYFQILNFINEGTYPIELILFVGSLLFGLFFVFQFFNFFLMAMLNTMKILSGKIFEWFETLPISREKLKKLILLTLIRSLDINLIVITFAFPIMMLIGTQNLMIFFICIGISIIHTIMSFSLLVLFSERMNRVLNINEVGAKRTHIFRLVNLASYIIIIIASIFLIQWALSSMRFFFILFLRSTDPTLIIMILSMIPFPIAPGYLLSSFITPHRVPVHIWINIFVGFTLFIILTYFIYQQSIKGIKKTTSSKFKINKKESVLNLADRKTPIIKIKVRTPKSAYIHKDLIIISRNLKDFSSVAMPIVFGFIFIITYYNINIIGVTMFQIDFIFNIVVIIGFNLIISAMIVYGLLNVGESGAAIMGSLPLIPKEQAKAKLILMCLIQTITVLAPSLMYISTNNFINSITTAFWALPFVLLFLFIMFEMWIYLFGKAKHQFLTEEVLPGKRIGKWLLIFLVEYFIYFLTLSSAFLIYFSGGLLVLFLFVSIFLLYGFTLVTLVFKKIFLIRRGEIKTKDKVIKVPIEGFPTWFTKHTWITISILIILNLVFYTLFSFMPIPEFLHFTTDWLSNEIYKLLYLFAFNLINFLLWIVLPLILLGVPYGKSSIKEYLKIITLGGVKSKSVILVLNILITVLVVYLNYYIIVTLFSFGIPIPERYVNYYLYLIILNFCFYFWQCFAFIGVVFIIILRKIKPWKAIILIALIFSIFSPRYILFFTGGPVYSSTIPQILINWFYLFLPGLLIAFLYMKMKNIFIMGSIVMSVDFLLRSIIMYFLIMSTYTP